MRSNVLLARNQRHDGLGRWAGVSDLRSIEASPLLLSEDSSICGFSPGHRRDHNGHAFWRDGGRVRTLLCQSVSAPGHDAYLGQPDQQTQSEDNH